MSRLWLLSLGLVLLSSTFLFQAEAVADPIESSWSLIHNASTNLRAEKLATDPWGSRMAAGSFLGTLDFGDGLHSSSTLNIFVVKYDTQNQLVWSLVPQITLSTIVVVEDMTTDKLGNTFLTGYFRGSLDFGLGPFASVGNWDTFLVKMDVLGNVLWNVSFDGGAPSGYAKGFGLDTDDNGHVYLVGGIGGEADLGSGVVVTNGLDGFMVELDGEGSFVRQIIIDGLYEDQIVQVQVAPDGSTTLGGEMYTLGWSPDGTVLPYYSYRDGILINYDAEGNYRWSQVIGSIGNDSLKDMDMDDSGAVVVTGRFHGEGYFDNVTLTMPLADQLNYYLARYEADGTLAYARGFQGPPNFSSEALACDHLGNTWLVGGLGGVMDLGSGPILDISPFSMFVAGFTPGGQCFWSIPIGSTEPIGLYDTILDMDGNLITGGGFGGSLNLPGATLEALSLQDMFLFGMERKAPLIAAVEDVPGDQGGVVSLAWDGSNLDNPTIPGITEYSIWRSITEVRAAQLTGGHLPEDGTLQEGPGKANGPRVRLEKTAAANIYWEEVSRIPAASLEFYSATVPTLLDSTGINAGFHSFQVLAHTGAAGRFFTSPADSGYSVDNLAPAGVTGFRGTAAYGPSQVDLVWHPNSEPDLDHYNLYRGSTPDFNPEIGSLVAAVGDTLFLDSQGDASSYYRVAAVDIHGNQGPDTLLTLSGMSGVGQNAPALLAIDRIAPNPFNPMTTIHFSVRQAGPVVLEIYDISGRRVRTLVDSNLESGTSSAVWRGLDDAGRPSASGTYFARLTDGQGAVTKPLVLIK